MRVLICGVPNVGKSTLINTLAGQAPGQRGTGRHRQLEQRITLRPMTSIWDAGMLWPRIIVPKAATTWRPAVPSGAMPRRRTGGAEAAAHHLCKSASRAIAGGALQNGACHPAPWSICRTMSCSRPLAEGVAP